MMATCLINVDFPPIFGPERIKNGACSLPSSVSFATKLSIGMKGCTPFFIVRFISCREKKLLKKKLFTKNKVKP